MKAICDSQFKLVLLAACEGSGTEPTARPDLGSGTPAPEATSARHSGAHGNASHAWDGAGRPDWRARNVGSDNRWARNRGGPYAGLGTIADGNTNGAGTRNS